MTRPDLLLAGFAAAALTLLCPTHASAADLSHPAGAHCVTYNSEGMAGKGTVTRCTDGRLNTYESSDVKVGFGPIKRRQKTHTITKEDKIFTVQFDKKKVLETQNPMYESVRDSDVDATDLTRSYLRAFGYTDTGETKKVADVTCRVYNAQMLGRLCMTDELIVLGQEAPGMKQTAVEVLRGNAGDPDLYDPASFGFPIEEGPNINDILSTIGGTMDVE